MRRFTDNSADGDPPERQRGVHDQDIDVEQRQSPDNTSFGMRRLPNWEKSLRNSS